jgi:hypothetical protein
MKLYTQDLDRVKCVTGELEIRVSRSNDPKVTLVPGGQVARTRLAASRVKNPDLVLRAGGMR